MLFNSYEFIFMFLPATAAGFFLLGAYRRSFALSWLVFASLVYYAYWRPFNLAIILPSIALNYVFARALLPLVLDANRNWLRTVIVTAGIAFNVGLLGYFKYANFGITVANDLTGNDFSIEQIILPLGLSFITFQKIAFLIDVAGGRIKSFTLRDYLLFVLFFPQLIAGPIVHYRESMPQFHKASCRFDGALVALGVTLFSFGLFKKVVLADGVAQYVTPIFDLAAAGEGTTLLLAWTAALGFTTQIYFDFSGYTDMACGAALLFGIRLPPNFDSPLKATNIIDFWLRWHMTLTRFLTAYLFNPLALALTRRRASLGRPVLGARGSQPGAFVAILAVPTVLTMLLSGIWHGAGYTFILWGLLHGLYLVANHVWRQYGPKKAPGRSTFFGTLSGFVVTFLVVVIAMVLFRAPDIATAVNVLRGMLGLNGIGLPSALAEALGMPALGGMALLDGEVPFRTFAMSSSTIAALLMIALLAPNSLQILSRYKPVLYDVRRLPSWLTIPLVEWRPSLRWLAFTGSLAVASMMRLTGQSEFLYWQF